MGTLFVSRHSFTRLQYANFYLTIFFGLSLCTHSNWQTAHARVSGVQPLKRTKTSQRRRVWSRRNHRVVTITNKICALHSLHLSSKNTITSNVLSRWEHLIIWLLCFDNYISWQQLDLAAWPDPPFLWRVWLASLSSAFSRFRSQMQLASFPGLPTIHFLIANTYFTSCKQPKARLWESLEMRVRCRQC